MRRSLFVTVAACLLLTTRQAEAQPLFRFEHDWTVDIGEGTYGIREVIMEPDSFQYTQFFYGPGSANVRFRVRTILGIACLTVVACMTGGWALFRQRAPSDSTE